MLKSWKKLIKNWGNYLYIYDIKKGKILWGQLRVAKFRQHAIIN